MKTTIQVVSPAQSTEISFQNMLAEWGNADGAELAVILAALRALVIVHQTAHWATRGDAFYADHLLFQRLYESVNGEVDTIAEKCIGIGDSNLVNPIMQMKQVYKFLKLFDAGVTTIPQSSDFAKKSYVAEQYLISILDYATDSMREVGSLTRGVDNMLAGMQDAHERHCYLLKQRILG